MVKPNKPQSPHREEEAALLAASMPDDEVGLLAEARRTPATVIVPAGYVLVDVVLPSHKAFIARKWAEQAAAKITEAGKSDAKGSAPSRACWAGFETGDRVQTHAGTAGTLIVGDDKFSGYLVPDVLSGGLPNPDAGKTRITAQGVFSVSPSELSRGMANSAISDDARVAPVEFRVGQRCKVISMHHPCFAREVGKHIIITKVHADTRQVWAHDDKPPRYRTNRNGRRVIDYDPRCIQSIYGFEQLQVSNQESEHE